MALGPEIALRRWPLAASAIGIVGAMVWTLGTARHVDHMATWQAPPDIWATLHGANLVSWGDLGGLYGSGAGLVSFPGAVLILVPAALVSAVLGLQGAFPFPIPHPSAWLVVGPYEVAVSSVALLALDAFARHLEVPPGRRAVLSVAGAVVLFPVDVVWGHPEDAVAVGLLLYATLAALHGRHRRAGWFAGAAVAVQPLVLLGLPVVAAIVGWRRLAGLLVRAAVPSAALLAVCVVGDPHATIHALVQQPNFPNLDRVTPWTALAPVIGGAGRAEAVAAGPGRAVAVAGAILLGLVMACRQRGPVRSSAGVIPGQGPLAGYQAVWVMAVALSLRCLTESVMDPYYLWPGLGLGLLAAAAVGGRRLAVAAVVAVGTAFLGEMHPVWWAWWTGVNAGLLVVVGCGTTRSLWGRHSSSTLEMPLGHLEADRPGLAAVQPGG